MEPGIIALDLDGTTICNSGPHVKNIPPKIEQCLSTLYQQGWTVFFVTGRSSSISKYFLKNCSFPYYLAGQNGSIITHQPSNQIIFTRYLAHELIPQLEFFFSGQALDFVIYSGYHNQDTCYYQRKNFPKDLFDTIQELEKEFQDPWVEVNSYRNLCPSGFPSFKCYGLKQAVEKASNLLKEKFSLNIPVVRLPGSQSILIGQATHQQVSKGEAITILKDKLKSHGPIICAGDDDNDIPMFKVADFSIVIDHSASHIKQLADIISLPPEQEGLAKAIPLSIKKLSSKCLP